MRQAFTDSINAPFKGLLPYSFATFPSFLSNALMFLFVAFLLGLGSAWYTIEKGTSLTTQRIGSWHHWNTLGNVNADPYTLAYMARSGRLPASTGKALYFTAQIDNEGEKLSGECVYSLIGAPLLTDWWTLSIYDKEKKLISTQSNRLSFNSHNIMRQADGGFVISISDQVQPGNWYQVNADQEFFITLRLYGPHVSEETKSSDAITSALPQIVKQNCG